MDDKNKSLIAVGAAAAVNCRYCLEYHALQCIERGASEDDVRKAIEIGFQVNRGAHEKMQDYVEDVIKDTSEDIDKSGSECCNEETAGQRGCC